MQVTRSTSNFEQIHSTASHGACSLHQNGGSTVGEIAEITGYNSDAAFIRSFKKTNWLLPWQEKRMLIHEKSGSLFFFNKFDIRGLILYREKRRWCNNCCGPID